MRRVDQKTKLLKDNYNHMLKDGMDALDASKESAKLARKGKHYITVAEQKEKEARRIRRDAEQFRLVGKIAVPFD